MELLTTTNLNDFTNVLTGFDDLDRSFQGFPTGSLVAFGGFSGVGKTSFVVSLIYNISFVGETKSCILTLENNSLSIISRIIAIVSKISFYKIQRRYLTSEEWSLFMTKLDELNKKPIIIDDRHYETYSDLQASIESKVEKGVKIFFIDSFQWLCFNDLPGSTKDEQFSELCKSLKRLALKRNIIIVIVDTIVQDESLRFQTNWISKQTINNQEFGILTKYCDVAMTINRQSLFHIYEDERGNDIRNLATVDVYKNVYGFTFAEELYYDDELIQFRDLSKEPMPESPFSPYENDSDIDIDDVFSIVAKPIPQIRVEDQLKFDDLPDDLRAIIVKKEHFNNYVSQIKKLHPYIISQKRKALWDVVLFFSIYYHFVNTRTSRKRMSELLVKIIPELGSPTALEASMSKCNFTNKKKLESIENLSENDPLQEYIITIGNPIKEALSE